MTSKLDERALVDPNEPGTEPTSESSRRSFLTMGASAAILAGFASKLRAQGTNATVNGPRDLFLLVDRATYGWTPAVWAHAQAVGYDAFLEEQLAYELIDDSAMGATLASFPTLTMTSKQIYDTYVVPNQTQVPIGELEAATVLRACYTNRQLYERMVEFWSDHFNVDHADGQVQWLKTTEDRDVIRVHALGNFTNLLIADAKSAAMLFYLDNYRNFAGNVNENYGREVMELHTLGVGNYTETDVVEVSRCLTGWQYWPQNQPNHGDFRFNATQHDNGTKNVLGHVIPPNGVLEGEQVLTILATHFQTAQFIARKMCRWLLTYDPPAIIVNAVARTFLATGGDIRATVRTILKRETLAMHPVELSKLKRPFHLVASVVRTCSPTIGNPGRLVTELAVMGHQPMRWTAPNGYPDTADDWGESLLPRWNFFARFFGGSIQGLTVPVATIFAGIPKSGLAAYANSILTGGRIAPDDVAAVQAYANATPTLNDTLRRDVLALMCSSPGFQTY
jgi:uncharacterized protein (DUF1800 family)